MFCIFTTLGDDVHVYMFCIFTTLGDDVHVYMFSIFTSFAPHNGLLVGHLCHPLLYFHMFKLRIGKILQYCATA